MYNGNTPVSSGGRIAIPRKRRGVVYTISFCDDKSKNLLVKMSEFLYNFYIWSF